MNTPDRSHLTELQHAVVQSWNLTAAGDDWEALRRSVARRVQFLLKHDFQRLLSGLYLLDVSEARVQEACRGPLAESAERIADLILERELQKLESRRRYASRGNRLTYRDEKETAD